jgi:hypothetical protein
LLIEIGGLKASPMPTFDDLVVIPSD